ncbi:MAG: tetratricopeptide repeat protein [Alphaproteobacteria bacterium]
MALRAVLFVLAVLFAAPAAAQNGFTQGYEAYRAGERKKALAIWLKEANDGHADAQWVVGNMFMSGDGMREADPETAAFYYRKSAEQGHLEAQLSLATLYRTGQGVERNLAEAADWLYKAAEAGHPVAQFDLGEIFYDGENGEVSPNRAHAFDWYRLAARSGVALAQFRLAQMYLNGIGTGANRERGLVWLTVARNQAAAGKEEELYWSRRVMPLDRTAETDPELRTLRRIILQYYEDRTGAFTSEEVEEAWEAAAEWDPGKY